MTQLTHAQARARLEAQISAIYIDITRAMNALSFIERYPDDPRCSQSHEIELCEIIERYQHIETKLNKQHAELMQC